MTNQREEMHEALVEPTSVASWADLKSTGLLWLINTSLLHPRGFALALVRNPETQEIAGWKLLGDGSELWAFKGVNEGSCDGNFADVQTLFAAASAGDPA